MDLKKIINIGTIVLLLFLVIGIGAFIYNAENDYTINKDFDSIPLQYNPDDSSSTYQLNHSEITVFGGFVKGTQVDSQGVKSLVVRALSPLPSLQVKGQADETISLRLENVNPDFHAKSIEAENLPLSKVTNNTLQFALDVKAGETINIDPVPASDPDNSGKYKYIILGDNRDGYDTFEQIIEQVNAMNPAFVIDNGDLVFSGKPNQYRLFDRLTSTISTTLCTTLGNHDIRGEGRNTYTTLYGPAYYSFDFADSHFIFLDSAPGWSERTAISDEQYVWLEKDLRRAQGKQIFVISHIPSTDPRSDVTVNDVPNYVNKAKSGESWAERVLDNYFDTKGMAHGFQDPAEAKKFESLMSTYHVDTVYLSHIHSYYEYYIDNVRYLITGGAGAELLTKNSYYHYMIAKVGNPNAMTMVELPSPANNYWARLGATIRLFATAMYDENPLAVIFIIAGFILLLFLLIAKIYLRKKEPINTFGRWLRDTGRYAKKHLRELYGKKE